MTTDAGSMIRVRRQAVGARERFRRYRSVARRTTAPAVAHVQQFGYTMCGLGFLSAAGYVHSLFTGLLVTGGSFLVLEWRVRGQ